GNITAEPTRRFVFNGQQVVTTHNDIDYAILKSISEFDTQVFTKDTVLAAVAEKLDAPHLELHVINLLNRLALSGAAEIWDQLPTTTPLQTIENQPFVPDVLRNFYKETGHLSDYRHRTIQLNIIQKEIITFLDGEHSHEQLQEQLKKAYDEGRIRLLDKDNQPLADDRVDAALASHLQQALALFKTTNLLYEK
ncbi:MAG: hypothetical protein GX353_03295, partial [Oligella ureolytica]|nr:hypothetical protein [Oligella ureolytica]